MSTVFLFKDMFKVHIQDSKLKMPENFNAYDIAEFPNFHLFMLAHVGKCIDTRMLESNADIIASIKESDVEKVTFEDLEELGVVYGYGELC